VAAFRLLDLASKRAVRRWQNKNRSKLSKQQQKAPTSKYSESLFFWVEEGTIARIDAVLERFEHRSHMLREGIEREIERRERQQRK
jgi:hypothetical protein